MPRKRKNTRSTPHESAGVRQFLRIFKENASRLYKALVQNLPGALRLISRAPPDSAELFPGLMRGTPGILAFSRHILPRKLSQIRRQALRI